MPFWLQTARSSLSQLLDRHRFETPINDGLADATARGFVQILIFGGIADVRQFRGGCSQSGGAADTTKGSAPADGGNFHSNG